MLVLTEGGGSSAGLISGPGLVSGCSPAAWLAAVRRVGTHLAGPVGL